MASEDSAMVFYHTEGSRVCHPNEDCHHLDNATEVEELDAEEAENYRTCNQCWHDNLSPSEKAERRRKSKRRSRRRRNATIKIRR